MNPTVKRIVLSPPGIYKNGLTAIYKFDDPAGSQVLTDYSGKAYHGRNGSTTDPDDNDVAFDGAKATITTNDYIRLPDDMPSFAGIPYTLQFVFALGNSAAETGYLFWMDNGLSSLRFRGDQGYLHCGTVNLEVGLAMSNFVDGVYSDACVTYQDAATINCYHNGVDKTVVSGSYYGTASGGHQIGVKISSMTMAYLLIYRNIALSPLIVRNNHKALKMILSKRGIMLP